MGTGYTRQSSAEIVTGAAVTAEPLNNEFNAIQSAFNATTGHTHDGTLGEGPQINVTTSVTGVLPVANGGTGASSLTDGGILLGSGTGAITAMAVLADGAIVVGDGTTDPVVLAALTSSTGTLKHEYGGLEADVSAYNGILKISGGATSSITDNSANWDTAYGWGNHASAGYVTPSSTDTLTNKTISASNNTITGVLLPANNLSEVTNAATARANLGLTIGTHVQGYSAVLAGTTASFTTSLETKLNGIETAATADQTAQEIATAIDADATAENTLRDAIPATTTAKGTVELADTSEYLTGSDTDRAITADAVWGSGVEQEIADAATITPDMSTFINAYVTLEGNRTLNAPTNAKEGQSGVIRIIQDVIGGRTLAFDSVYVFSGGVAPVLSTTPGAEDLLFYHVIREEVVFPFSPAKIFCSLVKDIS